MALIRPAVNLLDTDEILGLLESVDPDAVVNCAAYTRVDDAEKEEGIATRVNSEAVGIMGAWAATESRPFLTFSTDYVFSGDATEPYVESSPTDPVNAYGRSKLEGERLAVEAGGLVVRTSWVISGTHPNFVATMIRLARERRVSVVNDQWGCPTITNDLASTSFDALESGMTGLLHVTNEGPTTWFELARTAVMEAGLDPNVISPCSTAEYPTEAARPAYSVLASERLPGSDITRPPHWRQSLPDLVTEIMTWV